MTPPVLLPGMMCDEMKPHYLVDGPRKRRILELCLTMAPERHRLMPELVPGSSLEIVTGAGPLPTLEQPQATNTALARWMEE